LSPFASYKNTCVISPFRVTLLLVQNTYTSLTLRLFSAAVFPTSNPLSPLVSAANIVLSPQARTVAEPIIATVALMQDSGLPCFGRGQPLANLRKRFHLELTERQAAALMKDTIQVGFNPEHPEMRGPGGGKRARLEWGHSHLQALTGRP